MAVPAEAPLGKSSGVTGACEDSVEVVVFELLKCDSSGRVLLLEDSVLFALLLVRFESAGRDSIESGFWLRSGSSCTCANRVVYACM